MRRDLISIKSLSALLIAVLFAAPWSSSLAAQTPESDTSPPPPVETEVPAPPPPALDPPVVTEPPAEPTTAPIVELPTSVPETPAPTDIPAENQTPIETELPTDVPIETPTSVATETPTGETAVPTATANVTPEADATPTEEPSPTPTETPVVADQLVAVGATEIAIAPGAHQDITVRYTVGSDRANTSIAASIRASTGESLEGWSITPVDQPDLDENPNDANRMFKTRVEITSATAYSESFDITWRVTAPEHIEKPVTVLLDLQTQPNGEQPLSEPVTAQNFASLIASASVHAPTLNCATAGENNTWNCALETDHPTDDVVASIKATVPEGWELKHGEATLGATPTPVDAAVLQSGVISLAAEYPIGCPDPDATFSLQVSVELTYPSGELSTLNADLALTFLEPSASLTVSSVSFGEVEDMEALSADGLLVLDYENAPCGIEGTITFGDLTLDGVAVEGTVVSLVDFEGAEDVTATMVENRLVVVIPERTSTEDSGTISLNLKIELPHLVMPGDYVIKITTDVIGDESD